MSLVQILCGLLCGSHAVGATVGSCYGVGRQIAKATFGRSWGGSALLSGLDTSLLTSSFEDELCGSCYHVVVEGGLFGMRVLSTFERGRGARRSAVAAVAAVAADGFEVQLDGRGFARVADWSHRSSDERRRWLCLHGRRLRCAKNVGMNATVAERFDGLGYCGKLGGS